MKNSIHQTLYRVIDQSSPDNTVLFEGTSLALAEFHANSFRSTLGASKVPVVVEIEGKWVPADTAMAMDMGSGYRILLVDGSEITNAILQSDGDWWHKHPSSGSGGRFIDSSDVSHYFVAD